MSERIGESDLNMGSGHAREPRVGRKDEIDG